MIFFFFPRVDKIKNQILEILNLDINKFIALLIGLRVKNRTRLIFKFQFKSQLKSK